MHNVVLDPRDAADSLLSELQLWCDEDFEEEEGEDEEEEDAPDFAGNEAVSSAHAPKSPPDLVVSGGRAGHSERT
jgi:hypothetical protein